MAQNDRKLSVTLRISESIHDTIVIFGTHLKNDDISRCFFSFFQNVDFLGCSGAKRAKNDQFISLYLKDCRSYNQDNKIRINILFKKILLKKNNWRFHYFTPVY